MVQGHDIIFQVVGLCTQCVRRCSNTMGIKETVLFVKKKAFGTYLGDAMKQILKGEHNF